MEEDPHIAYALWPRIVMGYKECSAMAALAMRQTCRRLRAMFSMDMIYTRWFLWHPESQLRAHRRRNKYVPERDAREGIAWAIRAGVIVEEYLDPHGMPYERAMDVREEVYIAEYSSCLDEEQKMTTHIVAPAAPSVQLGHYKFKRNEILVKRTQWSDAIVRAMGLHVFVEVPPTPPQLHIARAIYDVFAREEEEDDTPPLRVMLTRKETLALLVSGAYHGEWDAVEWCQSVCNLSWDDLPTAKNSTWDHLSVLAQTCPRWSIYACIMSDYAFHTRQNLSQLYLNQLYVISPIQAGAHMDMWRGLMDELRRLDRLADARIGASQGSYWFKTMCRLGDLAGAQWFYNTRILPYADTKPFWACMGSGTRHEDLVVRDLDVSVWLAQDMPESGLGERVPFKIVVRPNYTVESVKLRGGMKIAYPLSAWSEKSV